MCVNRADISGQSGAKRQPVYRLRGLSIRLVSRTGRLTKVKGKRASAQVCGLPGERDLRYDQPSLSAVVSRLTHLGGSDTPGGVPLFRRHPPGVPSKVIDADVDVRFGARALPGTPSSTIAECESVSARLDEPDAGTGTSTDAQPPARLTCSSRTQSGAGSATSRAAAAGASKEFIQSLRTTLVRSFPLQRECAQYRRKINCWSRGENRRGCG